MDSQTAPMLSRMFHYFDVRKLTSKGAKDHEYLYINARTHTHALGALLTYLPVMYSGDAVVLSIQHAGNLLKLHNRDQPCFPCV